MSKQIYRFKFRSEISSKLLEFTKLHKFECPYDFKVSWNKWVEENNELIQKENEWLKKNGYNGDIINKMFVSVRYYYKIKDNKNNKIKQKRKVYVGFDKKILDLIDFDINFNVVKDNLKPSVGFNNFISNIRYTNDINLEKERLINRNNISSEDFNNKIKKTYKNRYFIIKKKSL